MFVDRVKIHLNAGKGGNGVVAWRREKYIPKGGPCGGNGSPGGNVIVRADTQLSTLDYYFHRKILKAENGGDGGPNHRQGKRGKDLILKVPCGTLIKDVSSGAILADLTEDGQEILLCQGGKGGRGNSSFKTSTNQAPNYCTMGKPGEERIVEFELKLIAEIGLVGFPNAGKSTLTTALTSVRIKAAPYPFTTLHPNLGFITLDDYTRVFIADIPGIIEGAHRNKGLGIEFLKHIERTRLLLYVLDCSGIDGRNPLEDLNTLFSEVRAYNSELLNRPFLVVLNKIDDPAAQEHLTFFYKNISIDPSKIFEVSALTGEGIDKLRKVIEEEIQELRRNTPS
ncbi:MAG: GTPase ObgE [Chlamydiales bacterium]